MWQAFMHKTGSPILPAAGWWADLSMGAGTPKYNAYVGSQATGTPIVGSGNSGLYAGENVAPKTKHLNRMYLKTTSATFAPAAFILCDYIYFYPLIDMDSTDLQMLDSSAPVPRNARNLDTNMMLVTSVPQTGNATATITYTNQDGVPGRTTSCKIIGPSNVGNINVFGAAGVVGSANPFIPFASGDYGVQSIDSIVLDASAGGFATLVMVEPLATILIREQNTVCEHFFTKHKPSAPKIADGAYLNFLFSSGVAATSSVVRGELEVFWN